MGHSSAIAHGAQLSMHSDNCRIHSYKRTCAYLGIENIVKMFVYVVGNQTWMSLGHPFSIYVLTGVKHVTCADVLLSQ